MSEATSIRKVLEDGGLKAYDVEPPEGDALPYVWLSLANRAYWGVAEPDDVPILSAVDVECWADTMAGADAQANQVKNIIANHPPGLFGFGTVALASVRDDRVDYAWRNPAGDERYFYYDLQILLSQYMET